MIKTRSFNRGSGFTLVELLVTVAILSLLATVAISGWFKYVWRTRNIEAQTNLEKLSIAAKAYFMSEHADDVGEILPTQFPDFSALYDNFDSLYGCSFGVGLKCPGGYNDPDSFYAFSDSPVWNALAFGLDDPHYFVYAFFPSPNNGDGTLDKATIFAHALFGSDLTLNQYSDIKVIVSEQQTADNQRGLLSQSALISRQEAGIDDDGAWFSY